MEHINHGRDSDKHDSIENQHNLNEKLLQGEYEEENGGLRSHRVMGGGI